MNLPVGETYHLKFSGFAAYGQAIYIDDIEIIQKTPTDIRSYYTYNTNNELYDILGRRLTSKKKGINIVRESDGTVKKIFVK